MEKEYIGKELKTIANCMMRRMDQEINGALTVNQKFIVLFLSDNADKDIYQKDIEKEFNVRRSSVTSILTNLENGGYIKRLPDKSDARLKKIVLTNKSKDLIERLESDLLLIEEEILSGLSNEEVQEFKFLLAKIKDNVGKGEV
ncbi:MAG: MarR family winged helix-turn-helix transcriptional regulator [Thomasclavelia sp.]|nr:MarR family winged helix-turn-helix transcriptional regulator [Thomasclavelia sp.]